MPTHHTITASRPFLRANFAAHAEPVLSVASGDSVTIREIPDVAWGIEPPTSTTEPRRKIEPRDPVADRGPCLLGPVKVEGAEPGDAVEVRIEHLRTAAWGWTYSGQGLATAAYNAALGIGDAPLTLVRWSIDDRECLSSGAQRVPVRPFLGMIGLAPADAAACPWTPRATGGNMDCRELVAGATLWLPVECSGAMLYVGDGHAAQQGGELSGTAIETMMLEASLRLTLHKGAALRGPLARTAEGLVTFGFAPTLDAAAEIAVNGILDQMIQQLGVSRAEALALASSCVDLRITQMVNPHRGVHAVWRSNPG
jgi:acetamidase/formamidase